MLPSEAMKAGHFIKGQMFGPVDDDEEIISSNVLAGTWMQRAIKEGLEKYGMCLLGACRYSVEVGSITEEQRTGIVAAVSESIEWLNRGQPMGITVWNDLPDIDKEDVVAILEDAEEKVLGRRKDVTK